MDPATTQVARIKDYTELLTNLRDPTFYELAISLTQH